MGVEYGAEDSAPRQSRSLDPHRCRGDVSPSYDLSPGTALRAGDGVGTIALGGHTDPGAVHFGVRLHGAYINPLLLLDGVPRAVLLPCC